VFNLPEVWRNTDARERTEQRVSKRRAKVQAPYESHDVEFDDTLRGDEALADSPFDPSNKSDKFHLNVKTGQWHDKKLGRGGGLPDFLAAMHEQIYRQALTD